MTTISRWQSLCRGPHETRLAPFVLLCRTLKYLSRENTSTCKRFFPTDVLTRVSCGWQLYACFIIWGLNYFFTSRYYEFTNVSQILVCKNLITLIFQIYCSQNKLKKINIKCFNALILYTIMFNYFNEYLMMLNRSRIIGMDICQIVENCSPVGNCTSEIS